MPVVKIKCVVSGLANMGPTTVSLKRLHVNPINARTLENGNDKVILAGCLSEYQVGS